VPLDFSTAPTGGTMPANSCFASCLAASRFDAVVGRGPYGALVAVRDDREGGDVPPFVAVATAPTETQPAHVRATITRTVGRPVITREPPTKFVPSCAKTTPEPANRQSASRG
jgi:hypothetical protein